MSEPSVPLPGARPDTGATGGSSATAYAPLGRTSIVVVLATLLAGVVIGALALAAVDALGEEDDPFAGQIDDDSYQAVILSNDKVYFGRLRSVSDTIFELDSAFFLRESRTGAESEPVRALLPINSELHAPENRMLIRKDQVVLVENLAEDSPVRTEIARQAEGASSGTTTTDR